MLKALNIVLSIRPFEKIKKNKTRMKNNSESGDEAARKHSHKRSRDTFL